MTPLDTLIAAVQCDRRADFSDSIARRDAALRATCEQVLAEQKDYYEAILSMTVARLGGTVEDAPTHRINFLQRIDALVAAERSTDQLVQTLADTAAHNLARAEEAEAVSARLRELAREIQQAWQQVVVPVYAPGVHAFAQLITELGGTLVRAPHGEKS